MIDKLHDQLAKKYGTGKKHDFLRSGSPRDWMMGIRKRERTYAYSWWPKYGFQPVGNEPFVALKLVRRVEFNLPL